MSTPLSPAVATPSTPSSDEQKERLDIYKLTVEMADRVSQRRHTANSFYLSVDTLLVSGSTYIGATAPTLKNAVIITAAGIATSLLWMRGIESYRSLNNAKFKVIQDSTRKHCHTSLSSPSTELTAAPIIPLEVRHSPLLPSKVFPSFQSHEPFPCY